MSGLPRTTVTAVDYGDDESQMAAYREQGTRRALQMPNRGPVRFEQDGRLAQDILDAYWRYGFYVFTNVLGQDERSDLEHDITALLDNAPITRGAKTDRHGRPALGANCKGRNVSMVKPLSDIYGGTPDCDVRAAGRRRCP